MWRNFFVLLAVVLSFLFLLLPAVPLGIPDEWVWPRQALPETFAEALDRILLPLVTGLILVAIARTVDRRIVRSSSFTRCLFLSLLTMSSFGWLNAVRQAAASPHREVRPLWVLYDKYASGYFFEAVFRTKSQHELLSTYEARMAQGDVLHEGTHPPGLFLLSWWALKAAEASPTLASFAEMTQSAESIRIFRTVEKEAQLARPLSRTEFSALCLLSFASTFLAAMTVIPVFGLVQQFCGPRTGWRAACLMITVPSIAVFAPRSDIVYAFTGMWILWLIVSAMLSTSRWTGSLLAALAAVVTFVSLTISLAHLPVVIAAILFTSIMLFGQHKLSWSHVLFRSGMMTGTFLLVVLGWTAVTDCNLFQVWRLNLSNHAGFYDQSTRTWWKWLLVNPIELGFSVGLPLSSVCLMSVFSELRAHRSESQAVSPVRWAFRRLGFALLMTWIALWLSGKNMGEAARLWCFLTPWFVIVASASLQAAGSRADEPSQLLQGKTAAAYHSSGLDLWGILLIAQLVVSTLTTGRVSGYLEL